MSSVEIWSAAKPDHAEFMSSGPVSGKGWEMPGLIPAVSPCPVRLSHTCADGWFPSSEPNAAVVRPTSVPHIVLL